MTKGSKVVALAIAAAVVLVAAVLLAGRGSSDSSATGTTVPATQAVSRPSTSAAAGSGAGSSTSSAPTDPADPTATTAPTTATGPAVSSTEAPASPASPNSVTPPPTPPPTAPLPVAATVSGTSGVRDGQTVAIHVAPEGGSQAFGYEAFLCRGDATFTKDADVRPLQTGKCLPQPLTASSDNHTQVDGSPPYGALDGTFRVGAGTLTYKMISGQSVTITCGPGSNCQIVLKLQYPNGFGFKSYPLSYA